MGGSIPQKLGICQVLLLVNSDGWSAFERRDLPRRTEFAERRGETRKKTTEKPREWHSKRLRGGGHTERVGEAAVNGIGGLGCGLAVGSGIWLFARALSRSAWRSRQFE